MMTPLKFEAAHVAAWTELEALLDRAEGVARPKADTQPAKSEWTKIKPKEKKKSVKKEPVDGARLAALYRRVCEHLALAQARAYPIHLTQRLETITQRAHRLIYRRQSWGFAQLRRLVLIDFPQAVRAHGKYLIAATLLFLVPAIAMAIAVWRDPGFVLHLVDAAQVQQFDSMYGNRSGAIGRARSADTDLQMFGFYIMHNTGLAFQCFAGGIFAGIGAAFFLAFNGLFLGAIGAYLIQAGYSTNFLSFVVTHSAFELTGCVLAGDLLSAVVFVYLGWQGRPAKSPATATAKVTDAR